MDTMQTFLFSLVVMAGYFIEGIIGFGGTIMALPFASSIAGLKLTVPVLTIVVLLASIFIAAKDFKYIDKKQYAKITFLMVLGLPIGMWLFAALPERPLKIALGIFMIVVGIKGIYQGIKQKSMSKAEVAAALAAEAEPKSKLMSTLQNLVLFAGGIVHGAFTCGGPFVVVYATQNIKDKSSFRATLCALWATLNAIMLTINVFKGEITGEILKITGITMVFVIIAILIANVIHKKIKGDSFTKFVYAALVIAGVFMCL